MNVTESDLIPAERQRKACHLEEEGVPGEGGEVWSQRRGQQGNSENEVHTLCLQALTLPHNGVLRKGSGHPPGAPGRLPGCTLEEKTPRRKVQGKRYSEEWRQRAFSRHFRNPGPALQPRGSVAMSQMHHVPALPWGR